MKVLTGKSLVLISLVAASALAGVSAFAVTAAPDTATRIAPAAPGVSRKAKLDGLYARLASATNLAESDALLAEIHGILMQSGSATADLLMARAGQAAHAGKDEVAKQIFDRIIDLDPDWAEAWNQRATFRFVQKDNNGSMSDIAHVLQLEPRHVGALTGMAYILEGRGLDKDALQVFRAILKIDPSLVDIQKKVKKLDLKVEGRPI
ncbi:MAG: hypothetical protein KGQ46_07900 [Hyphomicrobiales bacterium]|nr:hypothetical protein [Hyphomicrobiales bacterium]MDE2115599.1 hypothetical protein [Hyphomicrobiales bacterium]